MLNLIFKIGVKSVIIGLFICPLLFVAACNQMMAIKK